MLIVNAFVKKYRSELLLCAFIAQILASPLADSNPQVGAALALLLLLLMLAGATYMASRKIVCQLVLPLAGIWLVTRILGAFGDSRHFYTQLAPFAGLALSLSILWAILRRFNATSQLSSNVIAEALISYLVIASAFCQIYWILNRMLANPFNQVVSPHHIHTLLYFSMVTLSTVGYGGIASINPYVRMVAAIESIIGVFYIAVVVARLVASYKPGTQTRQMSYQSTHLEVNIGSYEIMAGR
jgi:hypothetical protein